MWTHERTKYSKSTGDSWTYGTILMYLWFFLSGAANREGQRPENGWSLNYGLNLNVKCTSARRTAVIPSRTPASSQDRSMVRDCSQGWCSPWRSLPLTPNSSSPVQGLVVRKQAIGEDATRNSQSDTPAPWTLLLVVVVVIVPALASAIANSPLSFYEGFVSSFCLHCHRGLHCFAQWRTRRRLRRRTAKPTWTRSWLRRPPRGSFCSAAARRGKLSARKQPNDGSTTLALFPRESKLSGACRSSSSPVAPVRSLTFMWRGFYFNFYDPFWNFWRFWRWLAKFFFVESGFFALKILSVVF